MELLYEMRRDHLRVVVSGPFDAGRARIELANIIRTSAASGLTRILVDARRVTQPISAADRIDLAVQLADHGHGRLRMAIVVAQENLHIRTLEDTATRRGVAVRSTAEMGEAVEFLGIAVRNGEAAA